MGNEIQELENQFAAGREVPAFRSGDELAVHVRIVEGEKERIQVFSGICIGRNGRGFRETFTVRKVSYGEGVERVFPLFSPAVKKIEVLATRERKGVSTRAKLYHLRQAP